MNSQKLIPAKSSESPNRKILYSQMKIASLGLAGGRWYDRTNSLRTPTMQESQLLRGKTTSRMSRVGCYGMTNADWLISRPAAQILPGLLRERVRMAKIKETERVRIQSLPAFFCKSRDS